MAVVDQLIEIMEDLAAIIEPFYYLAIIFLTGLLYLTYRGIRDSTQQQTQILENQEKLMELNHKPDVEIELEGVSTGPVGETVFHASNTGRRGIAENFRIRANIITPEDKDDILYPQRSEPYIIESCEVPMKDLDASARTISDPTCNPGEDLRLGAVPRFRIAGPGYKGWNALHFKEVHEELLEEEQTPETVELEVVYEDATNNSYKEEVFTRGIRRFDQPVSLETTYRKGARQITAIVESGPDRRSRWEKVVDRIREVIPKIDSNR